jgi:hypothetical protein
MLKGKRFEGKFVATKKIGFGVFGFPVYYKGSRKYWYEGGAVIRELNSDESVFFGFKTIDKIKPDFDSLDIGLDGCMIALNGDNYQEMIDKMLESLFEKCSLLEDPIPMLNFGEIQKAERR